MDTHRPQAAARQFSAQGGSSRFEPLDSARLSQAKAAYTTRFVARLIANDARGYGLITGDQVSPSAGDVVLARVEQIGQHQRLENPDSRRAVLFEGDEILVAYGDRYAPDQFESEVPSHLGATSLAAAGGVAGDVIAAHYYMDDPTAILPLGLLADSRGLVTLERCAPYVLTSPEDFLALYRVHKPHVIGVLGTSMNSGKTTTVAAIVRGLTAAGLRVAAGKITGTGAGGDPRLFEDSGAKTVIDFTHFGFASTFRLAPVDVRSLLVSVIKELSAAGPQAVVVELADGLFQQETARLVDDPLLATLLDTVVFAAGEAMGALAGQELLTSKGLAPTAISGRMTASPLATAEAAGVLTAPVLGVEDLATAEGACLLAPELFASDVRVTEASHG